MSIPFVVGKQCEICGVIVPPDGSCPSGCDMLDRYHAVRSQLTAERTRREEAEGARDHFKAELKASHESSLSLAARVETLEAALARECHRKRFNEEVYDCIVGKYPARSYCRPCRARAALEPSPVKEG